MKKNLVVFALSLSLCLGLFAFASADDLQLICPTNVRVGSPLDVRATLYNYDCSQTLSVGRHLMKGMGGNSGGTLGGLGMWGPYKQVLSTALTAPPATCGFTFSPGVSSPLSIRIIPAVPAGLAGTVAMTFVEFLTPAGEGITGGSCMVNVLPAL